jgi:Putative metal-binding motif
MRISLLLAVALLAAAPARAFAGSATFWVDTNARGSSFTLNEGAWDPRLRDRGFNDSISWVSTGNVDVTLYENDNFAGQAYPIPPNTTGGIASSFNDKASSVKVEAPHSPSLPLSSAPARATNATSADFGFSTDAVGGGSPKCSLDGAAPASCTSPYRISGLNQGFHHFEVTVTDVWGHTTTAPWDWAIDTAAPTVAITDGPSDLDTHRSVTFRLATNESLVQWFCRQYAAGASPPGFSSCSASNAYTVGEGGQVFQAYAIDPAGNGSAVLERHWTVDSIAPTVQFASTPHDPTNARTAAFSFTSSEPAVMTCSLDGAAAACATPTTASYRDLTDGRHTFTARARDAAGNDGSASHSWTVDTTAPKTRITASPDKLTEAPSAKIEFEASEPATFQCTLDARAPVACTSPWTITGLAVGAHTIMIRATDAVGNAELAPPSVGWRQSVDADHDGYLIEQDCNDNAPGINPGAADTTDNGADEDCDGHDASNPDRDHDGSNRPQDCNDDRADIHAGAPDAPRDGVDQDCDGRDADFPRVAAEIRYQVALGRDRTTIQRLTVKGARGALVSASCRGRRCPFASRSVHLGAGALRLDRAFRHAGLAPRTVVEIAVTVDGMYGRALRLTTRAGGAPSVAWFSIDPVTHRLTPAKPGV